MIYDLMRYVCPPNGKKYRLLGLGDEHCQCVQASDGWIEFRKNRHMEEFYVTDSVIGRGADTSEISRDGVNPVGCFYIQYTRAPDGFLTYGADWAKRFMQVGEIFHRNCHIIRYNADGSIAHEPYNEASDLVVNVHYPCLRFDRSAITIEDVLELQWGGEEVYYYAKDYGLIGWKNLRTGQESFIGALHATIQEPFRHDVKPRPPVAKPPYEVTAQVLDPDLKNYTNQQIFNAFHTVAKSLGMSAWDLLAQTNMSGFLQEHTRNLPYSGLPVDQWTGLRDSIRDAICAALLATPVLPSLHERKCLERILDEIPWISQIDDESEDPNDCGAACVLMLLRGAKLVDGDMTVDQLNEVLFPQIIPMDKVERKAWLKVNGYTSAFQLKALAHRYGLELETSPVDASLSKLYEAIDQERGVILGIDYVGLYISAPWDHHLATAAQGLHWLVVIGYKGNDLLVNDPLWVSPLPNGKGGEKWLLSSQRIKDAVAAFGGIVY